MCHNSMWYQGTYAWYLIPHNIYVLGECQILEQTVSKDSTLTKGGIDQGMLQIKSKINLKLLKGNVLEMECIVCLEVGNLAG